jgi:hypothetical protein
VELNHSHLKPNKTFIWHVARGCFPTQYRLQERGMNCSDSYENNWHFLCVTKQKIFFLRRAKENNTIRTQQNRSKEVLDKTNLCTPKKDQSSLLSQYQKRKEKKRSKKQSSFYTNTSPSLALSCVTVHNL